MKDQGLCSDGISLHQSDEIDKGVEGKGYGYERHDDVQDIVTVAKPLNVHFEQCF